MGATAEEPHGRYRYSDEEIAMSCISPEERKRMIQPSHTDCWLA